MEGKFFLRVKLLQIYYMKQLRSLRLTKHLTTFINNEPYLLRTAHSSFMLGCLGNFYHITQNTRSLTTYVRYMRYRVL